MRTLLFNLKEQYFLTCQNAFQWAFPIMFVCTVYLFSDNYDMNIFSSIDRQSIDFFVGAISIIMGFLINFLVLTKTETNTLLHKFRKERDKCIADAGDDVDGIEECKKNYENKSKEEFCSLFKKYRVDTESYVYNKTFFVIFLSAFFPLGYFGGILFSDFLNIEFVKIIVTFFVLFYLLNILNLLMYLYILFFSDTESDT